EACRWCVCPHSESATALHRRQSPYWCADHELYPDAGWESALRTHRGQRQGLLRSVDTHQRDEENGDGPADETPPYEETLCQISPRARARGVSPQSGLSLL